MYHSGFIGLTKQGPALHLPWVRGVLLNCPYVMLWHVIPFIVTRFHPAAFGWHYAADYIVSVTIFCSSLFLQSPGLKLLALPRL